MKQSVKQFNAWIVAHFDTLRASLLDEDAFQDAYLATVKELGRRPDLNYPALFLAEYRRAQKHGLGLALQYYRPNPLFFEFLAENEEKEQPSTPRVSMAKIDTFCRASLSREEYTFFALKFKDGLPNTTLAEFYGISIRAVTAKVHNIQHSIQSKFATAI